jgi:hypothetical protein
MPTHDLVDKRRDVGQRHFVIKIGKPARPHHIVDLRLRPSPRIRVKNHREKEREERSDRLTQSQMVSQLPGEESPD